MVCLIPGFGQFLLTRTNRCGPKRAQCFGPHYFYSDDSVALGLMKDSLESLINAFALFYHRCHSGLWSYTQR